MSDGESVATSPRPSIELSRYAARARSEPPRLSGMPETVLYRAPDQICEELAAVLGRGITDRAHRSAQTARQRHVAERAGRIPVLRRNPAHEHHRADRSRTDSTQ